MILERKYLLIFVFVRETRLVLNQGLVFVGFRFYLLTPINFIKAGRDRLFGGTCILLFGLFDLVSVKERPNFGEPEVLLKSHASVILTADFATFFLG